MDRRAMEETLPQLQEQNKDMLQQLERRLELLKQLGQEERLEALGRRADEVEAQQDELTREHAYSAPQTPAETRPNDGKNATAKDSAQPQNGEPQRDRKSTRLNSSHTD